MNTRQRAIAMIELAIKQDYHNSRQAFEADNGRFDDVVYSVSDWLEDDPDTDGLDIPTLLSRYWMMQ